jgi:WD40 repeat protein
MPDAGYQTSDPIAGLVFTPDGKHLAILGRNTIKLVAPETGKVLAILAAADESEVAGIAFSPDGKTLAGAGKVVMFWDVAAVLAR